jgi:hypothetical protein
MKAFQRRIIKNKDFLISTQLSPIAYYKINYSDGSNSEVTMKYGYNVGPLRPPLHSRFNYDTRFVLIATSPDQSWPEVIDCRDCSPGAPVTYQYEWINPHPDKEIVSIDFVSLKTEVIPALIALTVREAK